MRTIPGQDTIYLNLFQRVLTHSQVDNIYRWIDALESGSYLQGTGQLAEGSFDSCKYCCLGVANKVLMLGHDPNSGGLLSYDVLGLLDSMGEYDNSVIEAPIPSSLVALNDEDRWTFDEIANLLRDQLKLSTTTQETN